MTGLPGLRLFHEIGEGHFGKVYLGDDQLQGQVAVKVLSRMTGESDPAWSARRLGLLAEGRRLSKATHRNVVTVYHIVEANGGDSVQMVMEFCSGGSLEIAFDRGPMTTQAVRDLGVEVCLGLQMLHSRGMIHRDIKPANILRDDTGVAQLADFGLVTDEIILGYAAAAGYYDHLAKEVWEGKGTSVQSDIWAVGITLYRLLHGRRWYEESPPPKTVIVAGGFAAKLSWLPHVPKTWRRALRSLMADDRASRPQSAEQVLALLGGLPTQPAWTCSVRADSVTWERTVGARLIRVEWVSRRLRQSEWSAVSYPVGSGRSRRLDGSDGPRSTKDVVRALEHYFASA